MTENETTEMWRGHKKLQQEQHREWYVKNMNALRESAIVFKERDTACLIRLKNKPYVDFYPHTGRWRVVGKNASQRVFTGGGNAFVHWYNNLKEIK